MRTTIDAAGRIVIPRDVRDCAGISGRTEVEIEVDGAAIRLEPLAGGRLVEQDGRLVIVSTSVMITLITPFFGSGACHSGRRATIF